MPITGYSNTISVTTLAPSFDPDAQAFFDRVTTAGGTLSLTEKSAVNSLVLQMKTDGIWTKMKAIYPMVGGGIGTTAARQAACSQNLVSSSFTGSFSSGWTFASSGVTGNGTSAYMNTGFNTATNQSINNLSLSVYVRTAAMGIGSITDMGNWENASALPLTNIQTSATARFFYCWDYSTATISFFTSDASGMWGTSRSGTASWESFQRNVSVSQTTTTTQSTIPNNNVYLGAANGNGTTTEFSSRQIAFAHLGDSLSNTNFNNFYTAVQAFQTTLARQV
jgi:hypothetical protein